MPFTAEYLNASFGSSRTGIGTVGYTLMKDDGTVSVARTTAGVVEEGGGVYGKANISILDNSASILWDTGGGSPVYAAEDLEPARKNAELEAKLPTNFIMGSGVQTNKDDEIDAIDTLTAATLDATITSRESDADALTRATAILAAIGSLNDLSIADVQTALTNQGYTSVRALLLDNLDATITAVLAAIAALNDPSAAAIDAQLSGTHGAGSWESASDTDWTAGEKEQIRDSLGVDGTKTTATGGQMQDKAEPGDAMTLTAGERDAIRAEIMTYVLDGNTLGITMEEALDFIRKVARNRLKQLDGTTDNLILFDDDGATPLFYWDSVTKTGGAIDQPSTAPAERIPS